LFTLSLSLDYADVGNLRRPGARTGGQIHQGVEGTAAISTIIYLFVFLYQNPIRCPGAAWLDLLSPTQSDTALAIALYPIFTAPVFLKRVAIIGEAEPLKACQHDPKAEPHSRFRWLGSSTTIPKRR
jgi:hypothetical protein